MLLFVLSHILLLNKTVVWAYSEVNSHRELMLLDKGIIIILSVFALTLSWSSLSLAWSRFILSMIIWFACLAIVLDDIAARDISFSPAYLIFVLILAVGTMPFKGWQVLLLSSSVIITTGLAIRMARDWLGMPAVEPEPAQSIYLYLVTFILTGLSSHLYFNRYDQFLERRKVEQLKELLRERAKRLEKMKRTSDEQAKKILENERLKDRFFTNISHELRTPLTLILGPLDDFMEDDEGGKRRPIGEDMLRMMRKNGHRLLELINQLLRLSKIEAGKNRLELRTIDLVSFVEDMVHIFAPMAESQQVGLNFSSSRRYLMARIDPDQMKLVVGNLISNALKYTPEGGEVEVLVDSESSGDTGLIQVRDTGIGIPPEDLPQVFDRFYRANHSFDAFPNGTGIGLALAKEIVEQHNGVISAASTPGEGSEFLVELQAVNESRKTDIGAGKGYPFKPGKWWREVEESVTLTTDQDGDTAGADAPRVLVIDDNRDILFYLNRCLSGSYNVILKERSSEALDLLKEQSVDLIISDIRMPEPGGYELCRIIRETPEWNHIPIILLTAQASEESMIEGLEHGADDYISKPFNASELIARMENLIELRRILREKFSEQIQLKGEEVNVSSEDSRFLKKVQEVITQQMGNSNFTVDWLASEVNLSTRQLQRRIKQIANLSAGGYIRLMRLERASQLLSQNWGNVSEVADSVGFRDVRHFSKLFRQVFGVNPSEFDGRFG